jgi:hypothetical protein
MFVTEPQIWTIISVMAVSFFGIITLVSTMFLRVVKAEIGGLHFRFEAIDRRFDAVDRRFDAVDLRLDGVDRRLDDLDRDVQFLMRREIDRGN